MCSLLTIVHQTISCSIRYNEKYMATLLMTPGPNEPTGDKLQEFTRLLVDDLEAFADAPITIGCSLRWPDGMYSTLYSLTSLSSSAIGIPLYLVVVGVVADHPCMCK